VIEDSVLGHEVASHVSRSRRFKESFCLHTGIQCVRSKGRQPTAERRHVVSQKKLNLESKAYMSPSRIEQAMQGPFKAEL